MLRKMTPMLRKMTPMLRKMTLTTTNHRDGMRLNHGTRNIWLGSLEDLSGLTAWQQNGNGMVEKQNGHGVTLPIASSRRENKMQKIHSEWCRLRTHLWVSRNWNLE